MKRLLPALLLLSGVTGAWMLIAHRPLLQTVAPTNEAPLVAVVRVEAQTLRINVRSQGVVTPRNEIDWVAEVAGKVIRVHPNFVAGGFFEAGEELLAIDPRDYDQAITAEHANVAAAQRNLIKEESESEQARLEWRALGEGRPSPLSLHEPQLAEMRAKLKAAEAHLAKARLQRSRCELRAPFAGRVLNRQAGLGQYLQQSDKLARIYSTDAAEVRLPITTEQLAYLDLSLAQRNDRRTTGPRVVFSAQIGANEQRWEGRIVRSEGNIDAKTGLLHLVAEVREPYSAKFAQPLLAGLFVNAEIEGRALDNLFALPPTALNASQEAWLVDNEQRLHIRRLEVVREEPGRALIRNGLNAGDQVVISGVPIPMEGIKVRIQAPSASSQITHDQ